MSTKYTFRDQEKLYFITFSVIYWIDVFSRKDYRDILIESFRYCQLHKGLEIYAYCIMTNHVHMIIGRNGKQDMQAILRDLKKYTSCKITEAIQSHQGESRKEWMLWMFQRAGHKNPNNKKLQFWQQDNHPVELTSNLIMNQKLSYIHMNPVRAGIVLSPEEYVYSSAKNYAGDIDCILPVQLIE